MIDLYCEHAKEKHGLADNWRIYKWECFPKSGHAPTIFISLTGAVCEHKFIKGKRKGQTDWSKRDLTTEVTANISVVDHDKWKTEWEQRTGFCSECTGTGKVFSRWSVSEGTKYRTCLKCNRGKIPR